MALSASSILHYWSARYGETPIIGGRPVHTRSSEARIAYQNGVLFNPKINTPRIGWDTVSGERRPTLLLEMARTNGLTYSQELDNAAWTKSATTISANATIAPDGLATADKMVETATTALHYVSRTLTTTANKYQGVSVFVKPAGRDWVWISSVNRDAVQINSWVNVATGATGTIGAGHTVRVRAYADGWYRVDTIFESGAAGGAVSWFILPTTGNGVTGVYLGDITKGLYVWGAQHEQDTDVFFLTSYIPTTSAAVTRSADSFYWDYAVLPQAAMYYIRFVESGSISNSNSALWSISGATISTAYLALYRTAAGYLAQHNNGGSTVTTAALAAPAVGDTVEIVVVINTDGSIQTIQSINGAAVTSSAVTAANTLPAAWLGTRLYLNALDSTLYTGCNRFAELKAVKYADVVGATAQDRMTEMRAFEVNSAGEVLA